MPRLHAVELLPDDAGAAAVRADWTALREAGLPSMLDHAGTTNTPHVTVLAVPALSADDEAAAVELVGALLPVRVRASGLAVLGGTRVTLARLLDATDDLAAAVLALRARTHGHQHPGWLPHVTLVRRLPREQLPQAMDVVGHADVELTLTALRRWDPDADEVRPLASS